MIACLSPNGETSVELDAPPTRLLVGSSTGVVHLMRDDSDQPWREDGRALVGKHIGALTNAPGGHLFAGCHHRGGLFKSSDGGQTWVEIGQEIVATDIFSLAVLEGASGPILLAGVEPVNLYCSDDLGETWHQRPAISVQPGGELWTFPPPPHLPHLKSITINPALPNSFFACVEQGALLKTKDGGESWVELSSMWRADDTAYRDAHRLIVAPWNPSLLIFAAGVGVYRSENGGLSWTRSEQIGKQTQYPDVLVASAQDRAIFVGGPVDVPGNWPGGDPTGSLCKSIDDGSTWRPLDTGLGRGANLEALTITHYPGGYSLFAGDTMGRVFSSEDAGETWRCVATMGAISKGAHYKLADMSVRLPRWAGAGVTMLFFQLTRVTSRRAAVRRKAEFQRRASEQPVPHV